MGLALDTLSVKATNPGAAGATGTFATGDSGTVRAFAPTDYAQLERLVRLGTTEGFLQVTSPLLHDNNRGIRFQVSETPSVLSFPKDVGEPLQPSDTLTVTIAGGTAETDQAALFIYYSNVLGTAARLHSWGDIRGSYKHLKIIDVVCNVSGTVGNWADTVITTTEDLLHVESDYAVLGVLSDTTNLAVGIKGQETGNLRICAPGVTATDDTSDYFIRESEKMGTPHIPVFRALNKGSIYLSAVQDGATSAAHFALVCAELTNQLSS